MRAALDALRRRVTKDDVLVVMLIGHGTLFEGEDAKFNLVGLDLSADDWEGLIRPIVGRLVFVNTSSASFPFLKALARPGRIVVTATDSGAQQFETMFPEFFVKAFDDNGADVDKNGKVSIWEAFSYGSAGVKSWFEKQNRLATERALLDDTGAGTGREATAAGLDGELARVTYLEPTGAGARAGDVDVASLRQRRAELAAEIELLKTRQPTMRQEEYDAELERLLLEIAQIARQLKEMP